MSKSQNLSQPMLKFCTILQREAWKFHFTVIINFTIPTKKLQYSSVQYGPKRQAIFHLEPSKYHFAPKERQHTLPSGPCVTFQQGWTDNELGPQGKWDGALLLNLNQLSLTNTTYNGSVGPLSVWALRQCPVARLSSPLRSNETARNEQILAMPPPPGSVFGDELWITTWVLRCR